MTLVTQTQESFQGGAWPLQEVVPQDAVEDIVNGYIDESGDIARRGGSVYRGGNAPLGDAVGFFDARLAGGRKTILLYDQAGSYAYAVLSADETSWAGVSMGTSPVSRHAIVAGMFVVGDAVGFTAAAGGGAWVPAAAVGTVATTEGSPVVTGTGTNFLAGIRAGDILVVDTDSGAPVVNRVAAVQSVASDTSLTLAVPWPLDGTGLTWSRDTARTATFANTGEVFEGVVGSRRIVGAASGRLLMGYGSRLAFSEPNFPLSMTASSDFHEMPGGSWITAIRGLRDMAVIFTTDGVFALRNVALDLTDDAGNEQQSLSPLYPDVTLWDEFGIASWQGMLLVPTLDGLFLLDGAGPPVPVGDEAILPLYRSYVAAGYKLGGAAVWRSTYFVPVFNGTTWIDTLVCDLRRRAWSRWSGSAAAQVAHFARRVGDTTRQPLLLAVRHNPLDLKMLDLSSTLAPTSAVKNDADGTTHQLKVTLSTRTTGPLQVLWRKFRARLEIDDAASDNPTVTAEYSTGRPGSSFTALTGTAVEGDPIQTWPVNVRSRRLRIRLTSNNAAAKVVLRNAEWLSRRSGRVRT